MRQAADLYPGKSKTEARDAFIIAETAVQCRTRCGPLTGTARCSRHSRCSPDSTRNSSRLRRHRPCHTALRHLDPRCFPRTIRNKQLKNALFKSAGPPADKSIGTPPHEAGGDRNVMHLLPQGSDRFARLSATWDVPAQRRFPHACPSPRPQPHRGLRRDGHWAISGPHTGL
ncbi:MAG: hypothetical protein JWQ75_2777 [Pseudarthrobacter sp.]|nr:hypothetical protein [Pseudarthrobacter sp.]